MKSVKNKVSVFVKDELYEIIFSRLCDDVYYKISEEIWDKIKPSRIEVWFLTLRTMTDRIEQ